MRRWGPNRPGRGPAGTLAWLVKRLEGSEPLTADFGDRGRGFNVLLVYSFNPRRRLHATRSEAFPPAGRDGRHRRRPSGHALRCPLNDGRRRDDDSHRAPGGGLSGERFLRPLLRDLPARGESPGRAPVLRGPGDPDPERAGRGAASPEQPERGAAVPARPLTVPDLRSGPRL